ncbi:capsular polysaccharide biosynthesis protein [Burkholderia oklahomensis]|uniref:capsular polysaccharide export protein, LipB/KpsS family n=1 Tax=Burkholderia oklahomensis TaxID=342113 RepID=UPI00016A7156|nr:capsular polysaccharide biosynthesis protein [Burkholderia oklahomensis]AOI44991.1 capsular biosynthesis protein [Burkholderia oklahomensis C6786]KUY65455.1 capsular biosynthesis protein [Burkholderia oklahomensis C6786]MBI0358970.1 capsular biosynthesis protein [Burkholderia oklahomensis]SUW57588.1 Capsule polysaccharide biosynthesis protein [Burkholderia oklahomensis]
MAESTALRFDLRGITRGLRLASVLARRSNRLWLDHWSGRAALRVARIAGVRMQAAWPGPIAPPDARGAPLRSWFCLPSDASGPQAFADALTQTLAADPSAGSAPEVAALMRRVLLSDALHLSGRAGRAPISIRALDASARRTRVLLIDERRATSANVHASARGRSQCFETMLQAARGAHPDAAFWLIRSGDPATGRWLSADSAALPDGVRRLVPPYSLADVLRHVDHVYVVDASEGMSALLAGVRTHVFGTPYYAGWGLTDDRRALPGRTARPTLAALFDVVFLRVARYLDPATHAPGSLHAVLDSIELQHAIAERFKDLERVVGVRFQRWKRPFATPFLAAGGGRLRWTHAPATVRANECAALWGARNADGLAPGVAHVRIEDGFIHSLGLGSDMNAPYSQAIDRRGLYFDASRPSDLTALLNEADFGEAELARAAALRERIVRDGVTKYNLGRRAPAWTRPAERPVALVPGQVADDASIRLGTRALRTADALLREVRARRPDAFIVYKPHPDVLSGNRDGLVDALRLADVVDAESDLLSLIEAADEVHTLSSLAGFDALLRGKTVYTYGLPFYAGWGLTHDALAPLPWRERTLTLDMLTAGALLRYPLYWDWRLHVFTTPEAVVERLAAPAARPLEQVRGNRARPFLKAFRWTRNVLSHARWRIAQRIAIRRDRPDS